jgi:hypothetical protein
MMRAVFLPRIEATCLQSNETLENPEKVVTLLDSPKNQPVMAFGRRTPPHP